MAAGTTRRNGYAPIESYAALGDGATVALLAADGSIDWWAAPRLDDPPLFASLVDAERGGSFRLAPDEPFTVERRYLPGTNVVACTLETAGGRVLVTCGLNRGGIARLPWSELACRVEGLSGRVSLVATLDAGDGMDEGPAQVSGSPPVLVRGRLQASLVGAGRPVAADGPVIRSHLTVDTGERSVMGLVVTQDQPLYLPSAASVDRRLDDTISAWRRWSRDLGGTSRWAPAIERSALALKLLLRESSGAIAAAATTSLPERIGGDKNWDYRFAWVRDASFTIEALSRLGLHDEVQAGVSWLLDAIERSDGRLHVFYSLEGDVADEQTTPAVAGYRNSRPVRCGNQASTQLQLGCYGDLLDVLARFAERGHVLGRRATDLMCSLADRCAAEWERPDSGIWELPAEEHYTISKMGCWVALDRAANLAAQGILDPAGERGWATTAADIRRWINEHCWSEEKHSYTLHPGTDDLDAATLLAARTGFERGDRLVGTIDAVVSELSSGPYVYRYSGMSEEEGAFVACTFWLVQAMSWTGQHGRAADLMDRAVGMANDVGLLAEQVDPADGAFLGNTPQALSHLALIDAAHRLTGP